MAADVSSEVSTSTMACGMTKVRHHFSFLNDGCRNFSEGLKVCSEISTYPGVTRKKERRSIKQLLPQHLSS